MSMPVRNSVDKLLHILPTLFLVVAVAGGTWLGLRQAKLPLSPAIMLPEGLDRMPEESGQFEPLAAGSMPAEENPFLGETSPSDAQVKGEEGETQEPARVEVLLQMVASGRGGQYCLTNSTIMAAGDATRDFTVVRIFPSGVLYRAGKEEFFLQPGEKIAIGEGQGVNPPEKSEEPGHREFPLPLDPGE